MRRSKIEFDHVVTYALKAMKYSEQLVLILVTNNIFLFLPLIAAPKQRDLLEISQTAIYDVEETGGFQASELPREHI